MRNKKRAASIKNKRACRKWKKRHPEKVEEYKLKNKDSIKLYMRAYYLRVKEELIRDVFYGVKSEDRELTPKQKIKKYYLKNRDKILRYQKEYYLNNIEQIRIRKKGYRNKVNEASKT